MSAKIYDKLRWICLFTTQQNKPVKTIPWYHFRHLMLDTRTYPEVGTALAGAGSFGAEVAFIPVGPHVLALSPAEMEA